MKPRGFSLTELLIAVAILIVLAALLFPVFAQAKDRAKIASCQSRLRQFGLALNLYRHDHDDRPFGWTRTDTYVGTYPYNWFSPLASYLKGGDILWCPAPVADTTNPNNFYKYRTRRENFGAAKGILSIDHPFDLEPQNILVFCTNHPDEGQPVTTPKPTLIAGRYPFVREDLSVGIAMGSEIELWWLTPSGWTQIPGSSSAIPRFPNEPWPLKEP